MLSDRMRDLAEQYQEACRLANERLRRCEDCLRQGLKAEALHLAQEAPPLVDMVEVLDFLELPDWEELVKLYALAKAPPLRRDVVQSLRVVRAEAEPLQDLLRRHRLLALGRGPIRERLAVIRQLRAADPASSFWTEDMRVLERLRNEQIREECLAATQSQDTAVLQALVQEVEEPTWVDAPSPALRQQVVAAFHHANLARVRARAQEAAIELNRAYVARNEERARDWRERWNQCWAEAGPELDGSLSQHVGPALAWLQQEDDYAAAQQAFQADVAALTDALHHDDTPQVELDQLMRKVRRHQQQVPPELVRLYRDRAESLRTQRRTKLFIAGGLIAAVLLLAVGLASLYAVQTARLAQREQQAKELKELIDRQEYGKARGYLADLRASSPSALEEENIQVQERRLQEIEQAEQKQAREFEAALQEARNLPLSGEESLNPPALEKARKLAKSPQQQAEAAKVLADRKAAWQDRRDERLQAFRQTLDTWKAKLVALEKLPLTQLAPPDKVLTLKLLATELEHLTRTAPADFKAELEQLPARLQALQRRQEVGQRDVKLVEQLEETLRLHDPLEPYAAALSAYAKAFPETSRGRDFQNALKMKPAWEEVVNWQRMLQATDLLTVLPRDAMTRADACRQLLARQPHFVAHAAVSEYRKHLLAIAGRDPTVQRDGPAAKLAQLFNDSLVKDVWCARVKPDVNKPDMIVYYLKPAEAAAAKRLLDDLNQQLVAFTHINGFDGSPKHKTYSRDEITEIAPAPHAFLGGMKLPNIDPHWEVLLLETAERIRTHKDIDPLWKLELLRRILREAGRGCPSLAEALRKPYTRLQDARINSMARWMVPEDREATAERAKAKVLMEDTKSFLPYIQQTAQGRAQLAEQLAQSRREIAGCLLKDATNQWQCLSSRALPPGTMLYILNNTSEEQEWKEIGRVIPGKIEWLNAPLMEGQLVFVRSSAK
jgi:hypothetical protein